VVNTINHNAPGDGRDPVIFGRIEPAIIEDAQRDPTTPILGPLVGR
jgi:hypothetical protein